jgi:unsaturated rhamnogalacturonyl hydrolase
MSTRHLDAALVDRVASAALGWELEHDYWERQGAMTALLSWEHPDAVATIRRWLDRAVETQTSAGWLCYGATTNLSFGAFRVMDSGIMRGFERSASCAAYFAAPLGLLHELTGEHRYLDAAVRQMEAVLAGPRTSEGFLRMNAAAAEVWIDEVYPVCGALAKLGRITGRTEWVDEAYNHLLVAASRLVDPHTGLARHIWCERPDSFPESTFWSRGNGWLLCAAAEVLAEAPEHRHAEQVRGMLADLLASVVAVQDATGFLHDFLDDPLTPLESSGTLMFACAAGMATTLGVTGEAVTAAGVRALDAVAAIVAADGSIDRVVLPPGGPGVPLSTMPLGTSFFLLAAYHLRDAAGLKERLS